MKKNADVSMGTALFAAAKRRVIIHADDFGLHPAVNEAIMRGHRDGVITSASIMARGDAFDEAARLAEAAASLDLGLHFCLVGIPTMPQSLGAFLAAHASGQFSASRIESELRRQIDLVLHRRNLKISHIDSHQHLHALPSIMRIVCRVAAECDIPCIRLPLDGPALTPISGARRAQAAALRLTSKVSRAHIAVFGRRTTDYFLGMAASGHLTTSTLAAYCAQARPGTTEIVCHPGTDSATLAALYDWGYDWQGDLKAVCSPEVRGACQDNGVELVSWRS